MFNLWNPEQVCSSKVRLPPCHFSFILSVDNQDRLSGMLCQRSADMPVGVGCGNILFYSALIYMLAQQCNLKPKELVHSIADAHIYERQIPMVKEYLSRSAPPSPKLKFNKASDIFSYKMEDFIVRGINLWNLLKFSRNLNKKERR